MTDKKLAELVIADRVKIPDIPYNIFLVDYTGELPEDTTIGNYIFREKVYVPYLILCEKDMFDWIFPVIRSTSHIDKSKKPDRYINRIVPTTQKLFEKDIWLQIDFIYLYHPRTHNTFMVNMTTPKIYETVDNKTIVHEIEAWDNGFKIKCALLDTKKGKVEYLTKRLELEGKYLHTGIWDNSDDIVIVTTKYNYTINHTGIVSKTVNEEKK